MPPKPGTMPRFTSGWPNTAFSEATMKSQASASSQPPPSANPFTSAITGNGDISMVRISAWPCTANSRPSSADIARIAAMSAPATKAFSPAPVSSSARVAASPAASAMACRQLVAGRPARAR